jgi:hypothetical protein
MRTAQKWIAYVEWIGEGDSTRSKAAEHFKVSKSTATYHLERAVSEGVLERFYSWTDDFQTGWAYRRISGNILLPFEDVAEYDDPEPDSDEMDWLEYGQHEAEQDALYTLLDQEQARAASAWDYEVASQIDHGEL